MVYQPIQTPGSGTVYSLGSSASQVTPELRELVNQANLTAYALISGYGILEREWDQRFYRLCSQNDITIYHAHITSIDRVINYCEQADAKDLGMTLFTAQKIPRDLVYFNISKEAFDAYAASYNVLFVQFEQELIPRWLEAADQLTLALSCCSLPLSENIKQCARWWDSFRTQLRVYESGTLIFSMPRYEQLVRELAYAVSNAIDFDAE